MSFMSFMSFTRPVNILLGSFLALSLTLGCSGDSSTPTSPQGAPDAGTSDPAASAASNGAAPNGAVEAGVGVGRQGRSLDNLDDVGKVIAQPAVSYFAAKEKLVFEVQVPQALGLYEATNGEGPRSHDDFMRDIIAANGIKLPELPAGRQYRYDPETKKLMVEPVGAAP